MGNANHVPGWQQLTEALQFEGLNRDDDVRLFEQETLFLHRTIHPDVREAAEKLPAPMHQIVRIDQAQRAVADRIQAGRHPDVFGNHRDRSKPIDSRFERPIEGRAIVGRWRSAGEPFGFHGQETIRQPSGLERSHKSGGASRDEHDEEPQRPQRTHQGDDPGAITLAHGEQMLLGDDHDCRPAAHAGAPDSHGELLLPESDKQAVAQR